MKKDLLRRVKNAISSTAERFSGYMQNVRYGTFLFLMHIRAVKLAEKVNSNFILKYYKNWNLKGINSVRKKKAFGFSPEAPRGRIELNITKCTFLQSRTGQYEQKLISQYFLADLQYTVHISVFCIWIKQINKVNVGIYNVQKWLISHYILTL